MNHKVKYVRQRNISGNTRTCSNIHFTQVWRHWRAGWGSAETMLRQSAPPPVPTTGAVWGAVPCHVAVTAMQLLPSFLPSFSACLPPPLSPSPFLHWLPGSTAYNNTLSKWLALPASTMTTFLLMICGFLVFTESLHTFTAVRKSSHYNQRPYREARG